LLTKAIPAVQGTNGDETTYKVACRGRDYGLSLRKTYRCMFDHYNSRCIPSWGADELLTKVKNAYAYGGDEVGSRTPEKAFQRVNNGPEYDNDKRWFTDQAKEEWAMRADNSPKPTLKNAIGYITIYNEISDCIKYNELSRSVEVIKELPWHARREGKNWGDEDTIHLKFYLADRTKTEWSTLTVLEAVYVIATRKSYHPVREYLNSLRWDGVKRLDKWLIDYCGTPDSEYARTVGRKTLLAAVTRAYKPGCTFQYVLVLEGKQGIFFQ